jgi:hypothetical protein
MGGSVILVAAASNSFADTQPVAGPTPNVAFGA